jgi:hypothetical protein
MNPTTSIEVIHVTTLDDVKRMLNILVDENTNIPSRSYFNNNEFIKCNLIELLTISKTDPKSFGTFRRSKVGSAFIEQENIKFSRNQPVTIELKNKTFEV